MNLGAHAALELSLRAPFDDVVGACHRARVRLRRRERLRKACRVGALLVVVLAVVVALPAALATGDDTELTARMLGALGLLSIGAWLRMMAARPEAAEPRRLEVAAHLLEVFDPEIPDEEVILELRLDGAQPGRRRRGRYEHEWLRLTFTLRNDTVVGILCGTVAERPDGSDGAYEMLRVALVLPNQDLFGATRPEVNVAAPPGLTIYEVDVQAQAVLFFFRTSGAEPSARLDGALVSRAIQACRDSVTGLRSFSQPPIHPPRAPGGGRERPESSVAEHLGRLWRRLTRVFDRSGLDEYQARHEDAIDEVSAAAAAGLELDLHPSAPGISRDDLTWMSRAITSNLWQWRAGSEVVERSGWISVSPTGERFRLGLHDRVSTLLASIREPAARPVRLQWEPVARSFPELVDDRVRLATGQAGAWLAVRDGSIIELERDPDQARVVAPLPPNFDPERQGALAHDPKREVIAVWMRAWAGAPSRTFFWSSTRGDWTEHRHVFRPEDEHAGVTFLFDHGRDAFVRLGITYELTWDEKEACTERPAGALQLALSAKGRLAVSDPDTGTTLVIDVEHGRVARCGPSGWAVVAEIERAPGDEERPPHVWSILPERYRYHARDKLLSWEPRRGSGQGLALDLGPAFDRAASLDPEPLS